MAVVDDRFVVVDVETTGLEEKSEVLLEVGFAIYSAESLLKLDSFEVQIWDENTQRRQKVLLNNMSKEAKFILDMHEKSGLWDDCQEKGVPLQEAHNLTVEWLNAHDITADRPKKERDPWVGSSVDFDIAFLKQNMLKAHSCFNYRKIDVSSFKEVCRRQAPALYSKIGDHTSKREMHRATPDIEDTWSEFVFYCDNFLWMERG